MEHCTALVSFAQLIAYQMLVIFDTKDLLLTLLLGIRS